MEAKELQALFNRLTQKQAALNEEIDKLGQALSQLVEENNRLTITNYQLQEHGTESEEVSSDLSESKENRVQPLARTGKSQMEKFYEDGIHICPFYFGQQIEKDNGCLQCLALIARMEKS